MLNVFSYNERTNKLLYVSDPIKNGLVIVIIAIHDLFIDMQISYQSSHYLHPFHIQTSELFYI